MQYLNEFVREEEGLETIEYMGLLVAAVALIAVCIRVGNAAKTKMETAAGALK